jgi:hypothetical protein
MELSIVIPVYSGRVSFSVFCGLLKTPHFHRKSRKRISLSSMTVPVTAPVKSWLGFQIRNSARVAADSGRRYPGHP